MVKKRQIFQYKDGMSRRINGRIFIVKWLEEDEVKVSKPFTDIEHAETECRSRLEQGICSWMIRYNG